MVPTCGVPSGVLLDDQRPVALSGIVFTRTVGISSGKADVGNRGEPVIAMVWCVLMMVAAPSCASEAVFSRGRWSLVQTALDPVLRQERHIGAGCGRSRSAPLSGGLTVPLVAGQCARRVAVALLLTSIPGDPGKATSWCLTL